MRIGTREIGNNEPPYLIAEISSNHSGSLDNALALVRAAKEAGADAVKFQALQADRITVPSWNKEFHINDGPWAGKLLWELYKEAETPIEWWEPIMLEAEKVGITCFPSVFDIDSIPYLCQLGIPAIKISSFELVDTELIKRCALLGIPLILSTGMASSQEIGSAIKAAYGTQFALLHCVSAYPTLIENADLARISEMRRIYGCPVGLSDHSQGEIAATVATALGACIIEKHLQLDWEDHPEVNSLDEDFSAQPHEFRKMVAAVRRTWAALQEPEAKDATHTPLRRSLFAVQDIAPGEKLTSENVRSIRPGHGLAPSLLPQIIGRKALVAIERGTPLFLEMLVHETEAV